MTEMMKAICLDRYGGPEVLDYRDVPRPEPGEGEVLIRVHAAGVNPVDWKTRSGSSPAEVADPFPLIPGWDVAGVVEATGPGVGNLVIGDAVYGLVSFPQPGRTYAEYVAAPADQVLPMPKSLGFVRAAALPLVGLTAWQALFEAGGLGSGQTVLIHGAAGGVGHVAVQLAKARGATVIGTARGWHGDLLRDVGLDVQIDYRQVPFEEVVHGVDLVLDTVGGDVQQRSWGVLREGGILVTLRSTPGLAQAAAAHGMRGRHVLVRPEPEHLSRLTELVESGGLQSRVSTVLPLPAARIAHELLERGSTQGKIVLEMLQR